MNLTIMRVLQIVYSIASSIVTGVFNLLWSDLLHRYSGTLGCYITIGEDKLKCLVDCLQEVT